ncbi:folate-binding protein YgfZ [Pleomorphomonas sp. JP5]|uniref:CAF17-like 4Fe-4S cluster assembly/insertion protein YgfZ n=1 Tax=Pleomorphomonas sp. JP5 TaxID=2942998 RepID=UPI002044A959|nr:folate-binding protein [Pleomorphomonas sp. JP5]MCM5560022.1 folate-binding protein [Pleomorphomonas sp. JP5]
MADSFFCRLESRSLVEVTGPEASDFLDRMITQNTEAADGRTAAFGALLTPQGKIITDFLVVRQDNGGFLLDTPATGEADLRKRLTMFKLRADVTIGASPLVVYAGCGTPPDTGLVAVDPRHPDLGWRLYAAEGAVATNADEATWQAHRVALGVPEAGADLPLLDAFPHDLAMDSLHGIDFDKGCYVGQEVVSRMRFRGTARRRPVVLSADGDMPQAGAEILIGGRVAGHLGSASGKHGIAILRLDRVRDAQTTDETITVDGLPVSVALPAWADYGWPDTQKPDASKPDD